MKKRAVKFASFFARVLGWKMKNGPFILSLLAINV